MVVRVRFGRGPVVKRRKGKNSRLATPAASLLTMASISCAALGLWRVGTDLEWTGGFVFTQGLLSHWQVWIGVAIAIQYVSWRLSRYARAASIEDTETPVGDKSTADERAIANV
ncbi:MAG TPA: hypothetical protein VK789_00350 [Bryobacteraceae bacterium]|nr:hypothetical protein [Bryobacteraceae bacterium]